MLLETVNKSVRALIRRAAVLLDRGTNGKVTPNLITTLSVIGHLPVAFFIMSDQLLVAGIMLIFFGLFDVLDGELARLQKVASPKGMVYDAAADRIKETFIFSAITYYISQSSSPEWSFLAALALGGSLSVSYSKAKAEVNLALNKRLSDHHTINRYFSEGAASFEIRMALIVGGLLFNLLLPATAVVAILAAYSMCERLIVYLRQL